MNAAEFLLWVRGPGLQISLVIFLFGMILRLLEIFLLGRKKNLSALRSSGIAEGFRTVVSRSVPADSATMKRSMFTVVSGYVFHLGLFVAMFLLVPHIQLIQSILGFGWPGLPTPIVDFATVLAMIALVAILWNRLTNPVVRFLTTPGDYLVWALTFVPLLTGYMAFHHLFFPYTWLLAVHIFSVELMLILFPFTKLTHTVTLFISRWYNGMMAGQKGVQQ